MIPIAKPTVGREELERIERVIASGWLTQGPVTLEFESKLRERLQTSHCAAVSNCTTAIELALKCAGCRHGDVVLTVSHSFIATANAVRACGAEPYFVDVELESMNLDVRALERAVETKFERKDNAWYLRDGNGAGRLAAILVVHQLGIPADMRRLMPLADTLGVPVIEDAACAIGSEISFDGGSSFEPIGRPRGQSACFSFHPRKILTTGEGGAITTLSKEVDERVRRLRQHGMSVSDLKRHGSAKIIVEEYLEAGHNYRLSDLQAAVGLAQLARLDGFLKRRREIADAFDDGFGRRSGVTVVRAANWQKLNWQSYPVRIESMTEAKRNELMQYMLDHGVATRPGVMNAHEETPYRNINWSLPVSEKLRREVIMLPIHSEMSDSDVDVVIETFKAGVSSCLK